MTKFEGDENTSDAGQTDTANTVSADAPAPRKQAKAKQKRSKPVAKKAKKTATKKVAKKAKKAAGKKAAKNGNGLRAMTGEGFAGELRLNAGPRAEMAKHLEKNKGKFVTLASLGKAFGDGGDVLARQAVIRFRGKIAKYKLPYDLRTDEETAGRYGLFGKR